MNLFSILSVFHPGPFFSVFFPFRNIFRDAVVGFFSKKLAPASERRQPLSGDLSGLVRGLNGSSRSSRSDPVSSRDGTIGKFHITILVAQNITIYDISRY